MNADSMDWGQPPPIIAEGPASIKITKAKRYDNSHWIPSRDAYADRMMRLEGRGAWWTKGCAQCKEANPTWRCEDCFGGRMLCMSCAIERHRDEPLHLLQRYKEWEDVFFHRRTTRDLGLVYQLGHALGEECEFVRLSRPKKGFVVMDNNGIHTIDIDFCSCIGAPSEANQLLDVGWFPATHRLPQFMTMVREYRHLQMCKRAGCVHHPEGIVATEQGALAIECRACPQPERNLPEGWEDAPPEVAYVSYSALRAIATDITLQMDISDPTLGPGWAYMVANDRYLKHLVQHINEDEISHCVSFAALWSANNKRAKGLRASGVGSVSCSRHEMFRPLGTGDLQKGERYANMDYLFFSSLIGITILTVVASYDIACQWSRKFWSRAEAMPKRLKLPAGLDILFKVPKFHLPPHVKECHGPYSFNYTKGVGRTDGEGVERNWSWLNWAARSISVMGPGAREDTIDDLCGFSNWKKTVDFGNSLLRKMVLAIPQAMLHSRAFHAFTEGLRDGHEEELQKWEKMVRAWEADGTQENPYEYAEVEAETMADVMRRFSEEDHARVVQNGAAALEVKPAAFLLAGIEIEQDQQAVSLEAKRRNRTTIQATTLQRQRTLLLGKISKLHDVQAQYMPGLQQWAARQNPPFSAGNNAKPETIKIFLPSALPSDQRESMCIPELSRQEEELRNAQARDALRDLRRGLRTRTFAHRFKRKQISGQGMYTKSRSLLDAIEDGIRDATSRYRVARAGLVALRGLGKWTEELRELRKEDIRGMNERLMNEEEKEENRKARVLAGLLVEATDLDEYGEPVDLTVLFNLETGEGKRLLSWIWHTGLQNEDEAGDGNLHAGRNALRAAILQVEGRLVDGAAGADEGTRARGDGLRACGRPARLCAGTAIS
ncbi:hypothetical protein C8F04DRAFT_1208826 [Mycena alexandri]|uniref:CxC2-like cysteine cluster KDZ transposase-associated domain-containing protein n=1 Tax=Mycena alexandri TaxID=1745969 RepID=A0AAD6T636_9AGAR|nr:hypothetical protein C8F04DRAFT_1208826 [Mycena alexandri]